MSLGDRLSTLSRGELAGLVVVLAVTLGGTGLWYARSLPKPVEIGAPSPSVGAAGAPVATSPSPSPTTIVVDVAGEVRRPGVYEFTEGQRVIDALKAAGGPKGDANLAALNLAAPLADGSQVLVPASAPTGGTGAGTSSSSTTGTTLIDVNTADATQLEELPGIGEVLAGAIIKYREDNGPFASVDELDNVSGIGPATLADIRDLVTV
ncbi:MAG: ComEA family DNA-binding protein [Actinobacteria bacterium]|nr:ComEA family DNA-binding protein [Actinomycetota bacterium]